MDYEKFVDLDNVTLEECLELLAYKNIATIINDGRIVSFEKNRR